MAIAARDMTWRRALWVIFAIVWIGIAVSVVHGVMVGKVERIDSSPEP